MNKNLFNSIKVKKPKTNTFDLTHDVKMSGRLGQLIPCLNMECVPGDKISIRPDNLVRFAPMLAPVMHRFDVYIHYFFVPNRLSWSNWETFIKNEATGGIPTLLVDATLNTNQNKMLDYMGVPPWDAGTSVTATPINALPFAAYQRIYNEYYRAQAIIPEVNADLIDGANPVGGLLDIRTRAWEHDYFTAALPEAQQGDAVQLPIGEVVLKNNWNASGETPVFVDTAGNPQTGDVTQVLTGIQTGVGPTSVPSAYDPDGTLTTEPVTINTLRRAERLQQWLEKNARAGTRYIEMIMAHFGVKSSDARLQRPEYITGSKTPLTISEVLNTSGVDGIPQGNMAGHGVAVGGGVGGSYFCEEHGYIIGILSVMPKPVYYQGIPKNFLKTDPLDFYWPDFANIGEQEIQRQELFAYSTAPTTTFGYIPRYAEYKFMQSRVAGEFRTNLNFWHAAREFTAIPTLSSNFLEMDSGDMNRIFAVMDDDTDQLYMHVLHVIKAQRRMPVYGTPYL